MKSRCGKCGKSRSSGFFGYKNKGKNVRHSICKKCMSNSAKLRYENNKQAIKDRVKKNQQNTYEDIKYILNDNPLYFVCSKCAESDVVVLLFCYENGSSVSILSCMRAGYTWSRLSKMSIESAILCANCLRRLKAGSVI